jgi:hypothetical protein
MTPHPKCLNRKLLQTGLKWYGPPWAARDRRDRGSFAANSAAYDPRSRVLAGPGHRGGGAPAGSRTMWIVSRIERRPGSTTHRGQPGRSPRPSATPVTTGNVGFVTLLTSVTSVSIYSILSIDLIDIRERSCGGDQVTTEPTAGLPAADPAADLAIQAAG